MDDNLDRIIDILDHEAARDFADQLRSMRVTKCTLGRPTAAEELIEGGVPPIPARDIVTKFQSKFHRHRVGVFWDLENMSLVDDEEHNPADQINSIRDHIMERFGEIIEFNAYGDVHKVHLSDRTRTALQDCGVRVIDAAHVGRKEVADKMIIVDALWFALQDADPLVCIISRDSDFSPLLSKLRMKQIPSLVITTSEHVRSLRRQATWALAQVGGVAFESPKYDGPPRNFSRTVAHGLVPLASPIAHSGGGGVAAQPSPGAVATTTADGGSSSRPFADLVRAIKEAQSYCHAKCVYRSRVAPLFYQINPMGDFKEESRAADAAGVVKMGGKLGYAWIALAKDDVTAETGMPHTAPSERTLSGTSPWHITLRYSAKYPCYDFMESFDDADDKVMHRVQDSHMFTVVVLGPFPSQASAEQYFKTHFGKTGLIPYIVQQLPLSVLRLVMNSGPSAGGSGGSADDSVGSEAAQGDGSGGDGGVVEVEEVDAAVDQQQSDAADDDEEDASAVEAADHRSSSLVHGQYYTLRVSTQFNKFCHQSVASLRDAYSYGSGKDPKQPEAYEIFVFGPFPTKEAAENHFAQHFKQLGKLIPWYCTKFYFPVTRYSVP